MPVGAIVGSAVVGAGSSALAASKNSKAINKSTDATVQAAAENNALTRDIYNQNKQTIQPFVNTGIGAGATMNALLGIATPATTYQTGTPNFSQYVQNNPDVLAEFGRVGGQFGNDMGAFGQYHWNTYGQGENRTMPGQQTVTMGGSDPSAAQNAFSQYLNSSGYKFRLGEGINALNAGYAGSGTLQSGAAVKAALKYGQDYASNEFGNYLGYLGNQQGVGLTGANALAGVGTNYANSAANINSSTANALTNSAVAKANNTNAMLGGFANSAGNVAGTILGGGFNMSRGAGSAGAGPIVRTAGWPGN